MRKQIKRLLVCLLAVTLLWGQLPGAGAVVTISESRLEQGQTAAQRLHELGLFNGVGMLADGSPDFALERTPSRGEAMALLVRLLGGEAEAMSAQYSYPFRDVPAWAAPYVGYVYHYGISLGVSDTAFGTDDPATLEQFLTLVLRALGWENVDWQDPHTIARTARLGYSKNGGFFRADAAVICSTALDAFVLDEGITLQASLERRGAVPSSRPTLPDVVTLRQPASLVTYATTFDYDGLKKTVSTPEEAMEKVLAGFQSHAPEIILFYGSSEKDALRECYQSYAGRLMSEVGVSDMSSTWSSWYCYIYPGYDCDGRILAYLEGRSNTLDDDDREVLEAALKVCEEVLAPDMSEFERAKALHDWLVLHVSYRFGSRCFSSAGALLDHLAVCDGYTKAYNLLCYLAGIESLYVTGVAEGAFTGAHAWNKVKIDGQWYNVDVTFDDPTGLSMDVLFYDYFLVSDETLSKNHTWDGDGYWPAAAVDYPMDRSPIW